MKIKKDIPKGVMALICVLSTLNEDESIWQLQNDLMDLVLNDRGEYVEPLYIDSIFGKWEVFEAHEDASCRMAKEVISILKNEIFDYS